MTPWFSISLGTLVWQPSFPALAVLALVGAVFARATLRARRRLASASSWRRRGVTLANVLAWLALLLMLAPPALERPSRQRAVLLTDGATEIPGTARAFVFGAPELGDATTLPTLRSVGQLVLEVPGLRELEILGHGLHADDWEQLPEALAIDWTPPPLTGPVDVRWPRFLEFGDTLVVAGALRSDASDAPFELRLLDPAGVVTDSTTLLPGDGFALRTVPRAPGPLVYRLKLYDGEQVIADEPVAIQVREARPAQLLVVQSAPSFETRQLANWAADRGAGLLVSSRISRDRDLVQRVNLPADYPAAFAAEVLSATDLAVIDGRRWAGLEASQRQRLLAAIEEGMGLLLLADAALAAWLEDTRRQDLLGLRLAPDGDGEPRGLSGDDGLEAAPLPLVPWRIELTTAQSLLRDARGDVLESWRSLGQGRIGVSRVRETHRWATLGDRQRFSRYWSRLLRELGRAQTAARWQLVEPRRPLYPGQRFAICARAEAPTTLSLELQRWATVEEVEADAPPVIPAAMQAHASGSPLHCGYAWPATAGWYSFRLLDGAGELRDSAMVHVAREDEWKADRFARRQAATLASARGAAGIDTSITTLQPMDRAWAWSLLLLSLLSLWVERRMYELA